MFGLDEQLAWLAQRRGARRGPRGRPAARAAPRVRPRPPRRGLDADRLRARGRHAPRGAARTGMGLGPRPHAALFGLPIVLFEAYLPDACSAARRLLVGLMIMLLAGRLLCAGGAGTSTPTPIATARSSTATCTPTTTARATTTRTSRRAARALALAGVRDRLHARDGWLGRRVRAAPGHDSRPGRGRGGARGARAGHRAVDGGALVHASATRSRAGRCSGGCWRSRRRWASSRSRSAPGTRSGRSARSRTSYERAPETGRAEGARGDRSSPAAARSRSRR